MTRLLWLVAAFFAAALMLAACGGDDTSDAGTSGSEATIDAAAGVDEGGANDSDVAFAQEMIPHHGQAVEMATLAAGRTENPAILDIAERIRTAQDPEIEQMRSWLADWDSEEMPSEMEGMDHGPSGMMTDDEMATLMDASGTEFDQLFVEMMIRHHEGAIAMAQSLLAEGTDPDVRSLAEAIIAAQTAEIDEMRGFDAAS